MFSHRSLFSSAANDLGDMADDEDNVSVLTRKDVDNETMSVITENMFKLNTKSVRVKMVGLSYRQPLPTQLVGIFRMMTTMMMMMMMMMIFSNTFVRFQVLIYVVS